MSERNYATTGSLSYFVPPADGSQAYSHINVDSSTGQRRRNWTPYLHVVDIENLRGSEDQYKLDNAGFQFGREASKHTSFLDDKEIEAEYHPECIELIKRITGATSAVIFDQTIRRRSPNQVDDGPHRRQPIPLVHADQTTAAAIAHVHRHLPASDVPGLLGRRFQVINLWRPISHAAFDWPLALCDFRSVDLKKDLVPFTLMDREEESYGVQFNPAHKWKYMRGMEPDEFVLIKCFDSVQDGSVAILAPHAGFEDPNSPKDVPLRESIEVRALVFYDC